MSDECNDCDYDRIAFCARPHASPDCVKWKSMDQSLQTERTNKLKGDHESVVINTTLGDGNHARE